MGCETHCVYGIVGTVECVSKLSFQCVAVEDVSKLCAGGRAVQCA